MNLKNSLKNRTSFIFDMDGTVVDLEKLNFTSFAKTLKKFINIELDLKTYKKYFAGTRLTDSFKTYLNTHNYKNQNPEKFIDNF